MRLGLSFPRSLPPEQLIPVARGAEEVGLDQFWVVEDCFFAGGVSSAATALACTERITVGLGILPAVARNAAFTAMEIATLERMHPGRFLPGLGHGVPDWMRQIGVRPRSPLTALAEHLDATRRLLAGETVTTAGDYVRLDAVRLEHPPATPPPLLAGVQGPKSLALSGRHADGTILAHPVPLAYLAAAKNHIAATREHLLAAEVRIYLDDDRARARESARADVAAALMAPGNVAHFAPLDIGDQIAELTSGEGWAARIPDDWIDLLVLAGPPTYCAGRLAELAEAGVDMALLCPPPDKINEFLRQVPALSMS